MIKLNFTIYNFLALFFLFTSCKREPHFEKVDNNQLETQFDKNDVTYTLIETNDYSFYHILDYPDSDGPFSWDCTHLYYLKTKNGVFKLEPATDIGNGMTALQAINDSTLVFYTQQNMRIYGDFWIEKQNEKIQTYYDPLLIQNSKIDLEYKNGSLIRIGKMSVKIDSLKLKSKNKTLYKLEKNQLNIVGRYDTLDLGNDNPILYNFENLENGIYYFSYPGRKIDYTLNLKNIK